MFYLPRFYWKTFVEKGRMKFLTAGTKDMITCEKEMDKRGGNRRRKRRVGKVSQGT